MYIIVIQSQFQFIIDDGTTIINIRIGMMCRPVCPVCCHALLFILLIEDYFNLDRFFFCCQYS